MELFFINNLVLHLILGDGGSKIKKVSCNGKVMDDSSICQLAKGKNASLSVDFTAGKKNNCLIAFIKKCCLSPQKVMYILRNEL